LNITGDATESILNATFSGGALTSVIDCSVTSVETINADMGAGVDWLVYATASDGVSVNLGLGTASGFTWIAGLENVIGGNGNDTLTGGASANKLTGGGGDDTR